MLKVLRYVELYKEFDDKSIKFPYIVQIKLLMYVLE